MGVTRSINKNDKYVPCPSRLNGAPTPTPNFSAVLFCGAPRKRSPKAATHSRRPNIGLRRICLPWSGTTDRPAAMAPEEESKAIVAGDDGGKRRREAGELERPRQHWPLTSSGSYCSLPRKLVERICFRFLNAE